MTPPSSRGDATLLLRRDDVARLLHVPDCIDAVERAFLRHARAEAIPPAVLGTHVEGGGFHVKTAGMLDAADGRPVFAAKVNANFPGNPDRNGLPTVQGVLALFDAANGRLLALLDSIEITILRTAAATAVAAKYLAPDVATVAICGCGEQARSQLRALACVRPLERVAAIDVNVERATRFAREMAAELDLDVFVAREPSEVARDTNVWVTCTPAHRWFLGREHVAPGSFIAAVGADNPEKQEIEPELLAVGVVVADILEQCATIGDLHHALDAGVMHREDVRAELADLVAGTKTGRHSADEIIIFDSTGTALQDVASAAIVYERAMATGTGIAIDLGGMPASAPRGAGHRAQGTTAT
jgi:ornithine cyclodeaminase/alanine dehydrogenase-like protein (mu-crystallin family)